MTTPSRSQPKIAEQLRTLYATHPICIEAAEHIEALEVALQKACATLSSYGEPTDRFRAALQEQPK